MKNYLPKTEQKEKRVQIMFSSSARRYDLVNSVLSLGLHKRWKRFTVEQTGLSEGDSALDLCSGTNDIAILLAQKVGKKGQVFAVDFNQEMIEIGKYKVAKANLNGRVTSQVGNVEKLALPSDQFGAVTIGFGIRNVVNREKALAEMYRVLKPGGRLVCLEFSVPSGKIFRNVYDFYSFRILPYLGTWISKDSSGVYHYLPASIRDFLTPPELQKMMEKVGFGKVKFHYLSGGIVTVHVGQK